MPCIKVKGGYQIQREKGGMYPKVYESKSECETRVEQMETYKHMTSSEKKSAMERIK